MKLFGYLLVACAGLGLFACSTEDEVPSVTDGSKSVTLKINGVASAFDTKAVDAPSVSTTMRLKDVKIVFYNQGSGTIYRSETLTDASTDWAALTTGSGVIYHNLNPLIDAVLIVGNNVGKTITWTNANTIKASQLDAAGENTEVATGDTKEYVTLFGEDLSLATVAEPNADPHYTLYNAEIELKPLVARFEIGNIQCDNLNSALYSSFELEGIGLIDFNRFVTLGTGVAVAPKLLINTDILEPGSTPVAGKYVFGAAPEIAWAYNSIASILMDAPGDIYNPGATNSERYAYNFFPNGFPNIKLVLDNVLALDPNVVVTYKYVATATFTGHAAPIAGHIYQINLTFKEINIGPWDPTSTICVNVDVTVLPWTIETLTPVFH